jgi:asparagine synthetase B (glutamine-hydrolysing)
LRWLEDVHDPEAMAKLLAQTVRVALRRAVEGVGRVAVAVGGLDSSGLLGLLRAECPDLSIVALTFDIDDVESDVPYVRELCAALGVELQLVSLANPDFEGSLVMDHRPFAMFGGVTERMLLLAARAHGASVLLYGHFGDDLFGGYLPSLGSARLTRTPMAAIRCAMEVELPWSFGARGRARDFLVGPLAQRVMPRAMRIRRIERFLRRKYPWVTPAGWELTKRAIPTLVAGDARPVVTPGDLVAQRLSGADALDHLDQRAQLWVATGVRGVDPLLDPACVALTSAIPPEVLSDGDRYRGLFRRALRGFVPERVRLRRGKGDGRAERARLRSLAAKSVRPYVRLPRLERLGLVDGATFEREEAASSGAEIYFWPFIAAEAFLAAEAA